MTKTFKELTSQDQSKIAEEVFKDLLAFTRGNECTASTSLATLFELNEPVSKVWQARFNLDDYSVKVEDKPKWLYTSYNIHQHFNNISQALTETPTWGELSTFVNAYRNQTVTEYMNELINQSQEHSDANNATRLFSKSMMVFNVYSTTDLSKYNW